MQEKIVRRARGAYERVRQLRWALRAWYHGDLAAEFPSGHFYSPIPSLVSVRADEERLFQPGPPELAGIDMNESGQLAMLERFASFYGEMPFRATPGPGQRYGFENSAFSYADAIALYSMIRHAQPRRIIEVGSGYSSAAMLDVNQQFFANAIQLTFIEPYAELLRSLLVPEDFARVEIIAQRVQDVWLERFAVLEANDILFIDSTHVAKIGSDVNYLFFEVLPRLNQGVYIHVHDIFYPFEYPRDWVYAGRAWNEAYLLRTFLQFNRAFEVVYMNHYMQRFHEAEVVRALPLAQKNFGGSLWLRRV
jgi:predicted O-methyltransferase YrrM